MIQEDDSFDEILPNMQESNLTEGTQQKRSFVRYACDNKAVVTNLKTKKSKYAKIINISLNGVALSLDLEDGEVLSEIAIEVYESELLKSFTVIGDTRYSRGQSPVVIIGVEFETISRLSYRKIQEFIETAEEYF